MIELDAPRLLDVIDIAEPCQVPWETMSGDERIRFCGQCKKSVYNISDMSSASAENFLQANVGSVCLTFIRRSDGTIVTDACPKFFRPVRNCYRVLQKVVVLLLGTVFTSVTFAPPASAQRSRGFVYAPNVWRDEAKSLKLQELTSGEFALAKSEVYLANGRIYVNETKKRQEKSKTITSANEVSSCINGVSVSELYARAKNWAANHEDRIASTYFKLALKEYYLLRMEPDSQFDVIVRQYASLLKRNGRIVDAKKLLVFGKTKGKKPSYGQVPKGHSLLGLDPSFLTRPRTAPNMEPCKHFSKFQHLSDPFGQNSLPQDLKNTEKISPKQSAQ